MFRTSFLMIAIFVTLLLGACGAQNKRPSTMPLTPGEDACTTTIRSASGTTVIRAVPEGLALRAVVDVDGDGRADEQRLSTFDSEGRLMKREWFAAKGQPVLGRETRTYDGLRLLTTQTDRWNSAGEVGPDGIADGLSTHVWDGERLVREEFDQLGADGLPGVDGNPEFVTTWAYSNGVRTTGTRVDARDQTIVQLETLTWEGDRVVRRAIDLGGDGEVDVTFTHMWKGKRVVAVKVEGGLDPSEISLEYCR